MHRPYDLIATYDLYLYNPKRLQQTFVEYIFSQTYKYFNKYNIKTEEKRALLKLQGAQHKNSKPDVCK